MINYFYKNHFVRKRFGQHFLNDQFIINKIVSLINPKKDQAIVEIGPGLAELTEKIIRYVDELTVIEIDKDLVALLKKNVSLKKKINIYQKDVMKVDFDNLSKIKGNPLRIFGNLPYNISISIILYLFKYSNIITDMHFMLQKEVADRISAIPKNKSYGRLSIITQYYCRVFFIFEVPSTVFFPQPKVNSAIVKLVPHRNFPYKINNIRTLDIVLKKAFGQRRKKIRNSLRGLFTADTLINMGIDPEIRAEEIYAEQYYKMANYINNVIYIKK